MSRIMALDVGDKKIGIAVTDILKIMAQPHSTVRFNNEDEKLEKIVNLAKDLDVDLIVIGLPKNMDGTEGCQAIKTREYSLKLKELSNINIEFIDERLTTKKSLQDLNYMSVKKIKEKKILDTQAAVNILESFLLRKNKK